MKPIRLFVTGTDTGVGKTYVSVELCREARRRGWSVFAHKPIETGCQLVDGTRIPEDARNLVDAAGGWQTDELQNQYAFEQPVAPAVAARAAGVTIDLEKIATTIAKGSAGRDLSIVEGAGGWRVPISEHDDMATLGRRLAMPVVVVARASLGTINHALLTAEAVEYDGCELWGIVLSVLPTDDVTMARSNRDEIERRAGCPVWILDAAGVLDRS